MPQLVKGRKWGFGWVVVGQQGEVRIPPETYSEYRPKTLAIQPGERLLAVRGSGLALGFLQQGPMYEEALLHPEIEVFSA